ncbi:MAG: DUF58 domain-containing protein, partial [Deltaproteobacteria bacterium]
VGLELVRRLPPVARQGEPAELVLELRTDAPHPVRVHLREVLAPELVAEPIDLFLRIPAGGRVEHRQPLVPRLRGPVHPAPSTLRVQGPSGLAWSQRSIDHGDALSVHPRSRLDGEAGLLVRHLLEHRPGANPVRRPGLSTELYALREYRPGDPLRSIHWKASARLRRPVTREDSWEQNQSLVLLVDCGRPMAALSGVQVPGADGGRVALSKLDLVLGLVLNLARVAVAHHDHVTLVLFSKEIRRVVRVDRRSRSLARVFSAVHDVRADLDEPDYLGAAHWTARHVPRQSLVLVCSSVIDLAGADQLGLALGGLARRHRALLVDLQDPGLVRHATGVPDDIEGAYAKVSALTLMHENHRLTRRLAAAGVDVLSAPASRLPLHLLQRYLDLKARRRP